MARTVDITKKIEELRSVLQKYNGIPSQTVDRAAHANIKYYIKRYSDNPDIKALMEEYGLSYTKRDDFDTRLEKVKAILTDIGRMPSSSQENAQYNNIKYFFKRYKDVPEVEKLKYVYALGCFPLPDTKYVTKPDSRYYYDEFLGRAYMSDTYFEWKDNVSYEYIEYVFKRFQELPGKETKPMVRLRNKIDHWYRYNEDTYKSERSRLRVFLQRMIENGCEDELITQAYYSFKFNNVEVQKHVEQLLIENGACAIHYIAQIAMRESTLSDKFVYYYYYVKLNDKYEIRGKKPLAALYSRMEPYRVLRIHYRDYHKCDVNKIRESARKNYRDWRKFNPETLEDWKYYGQSEFFEDKEDSFEVTIDEEYNNSFDWSSTYIEKQLIKGEPYFRYYKDQYRYLDYCLYLLENGYEIKDHGLLGLLNAERLADAECLTDEDWAVYAQILKYLSNCFCDSSGGYYFQKEDKCVLLCLTREVVTYQLNEKTTKIARNAFRFVEESIENLILNSKLISKQSPLDKCKKLKQIKLPAYCFDRYLNLFAKIETTKFYDLNGNKILVSPIIASNKLIFVPYTDKYIVPDYIEEIDREAFEGSGIRQLTISGGVKKLNDRLFYGDKELEEVTILDGIERMSEVFCNCINLKKVTLPPSLTHLNETFKGCSSLDTINLENITYIGRETFQGCTSLETITFDRHLRALEFDAFDCCTNLKHIEFKNGIDFIDGAFSGCRYLETITFRGQYESFGSRFTSWCFYECENLKAIYVQADYLDLFKEKISPQYQPLLKALY